jgi:hypothetical protein
MVTNDILREIRLLGFRAATGPEPLVTTVAAEAGSRSQWVTGQLVAVSRKASGARNLAVIQLSIHAERIQRSKNNEEGTV